MDQTLYKAFKASRGFTYHYYFSPSHQPRGCYILFLHGFPSTSYDWHPQVDFFKRQGYGLIVPDLLGYGGTDKPTTVESYRMSLMVKDVIEILDHEKLANVIGIGHDWGAGLLSHLAYYHQDRFAAFGFLGVFMPPDPGFKKTIDETEKRHGYNIFGYWEFFSSEDAPRIIVEHLESFYTLIFPSNPLYWKEHFAPLGKARAWISSNRIEERVPYLDEDEWRTHQKNLTQGGLAAPLCWYRAMVEGFTPAEEQTTDESKLAISRPVFFGAALHDYICRSDVMKPAVRKHCPKAKIVDFDTDHWINLAARDQVNEELLKWIQGDVRVDQGNNAS